MCQPGTKHSHRTGKGISLLLSGSGELVMIAAYENVTNGVTGVKGILALGISLT